MNLDDRVTERAARAALDVAVANAILASQDVRVSYYQGGGWQENQVASVAQLDDGRWICRRTTPELLLGKSLAIFVHDVGTLDALEPFEQMKGFLVGTMTPLPPHARMSSYDLGDTVIITNSQLQGRIGEVIGVSKGSITVQGHAGGPRGVWQVRPDCVGALFPGGDVLRYEEILPGAIRFPPGTLVGFLVDDPGLDPWVVTGWSQGLAHLQSLTTARQVPARKRQLFHWPDRTSGR